MGFESYTRAEELYQVEVHRLTEIAYAVYASDRGIFLRLIAEAWIQANQSEKRIFMPCWSAIVVKYSLDKEASG